MEFKELYEEIKACKLCEPHIEARPVFAFSPASAVLIIGQAPGIRVHESGIPWNDASGDNLRSWLGVDKETFYKADLFGIVPMGFCYPGKGKTGDLAPRPECAPQWHPRISQHLIGVKLIVLIGQYAQDYYLPSARAVSLTDKVKNFKSYLPEFFVLPHPSPRNNIWKKRNPWFESEVIPALKHKVSEILNLR